VRVIPRYNRRVVERRRIRVRGIVQGVGFRQFVYRQALRHGLAGFVLNDGEGVLIEAEGEPETLDRFSDGLRLPAPRLARVDAVEWRAVRPPGERDFAIVSSQRP